MKTALEGISEREFERERAEWIRMAWFCSVLLAPYNQGRPVDMNELLPEIFKLEDGKNNDGAELEALKKRLRID